MDASSFVVGLMTPPPWHIEIQSGRGHHPIAKDMRQMRAGTRSDGNKSAYGMLTVKDETVSDLQSVTPINYNEIS